MNKKHQTTKPKPRRKKTPKFRTGVFGDMQSASSWRTCKFTPSLRERIIDLMPKFLEESEEHNSVIGFTAWLGIPYRTYQQWAHDDQKMNEAHGMFVEVLTARKAKHAEYKKYGANENIIKATLYQQHPDYRKAREDEEAFKEKMKEKQEQTPPSAVNIYMEDFKQEEK